ncbi:MAG: ATP--guanido phosphotransferase [Ruminococcaceae bacterium]|nr:ATP--guanido phosphotransferase [Oscillospiraceae bacterium]MBQ6874416.1 protein arginine kinase [Clostridia bacterium]
MSKWYENKGKENDVVLNTRIRLVRNLDEFPFPARLGKNEREQVNNIIRDIILGENEFQLSYVETDSLTNYQVVSLAERYLISPEFASDSEGRGLLLSEDEAISIMLCEEDHIRLQVISSGLDFDRTYEVISSLDSVIDNNADYAFDEKIGYLTQSPSNLGTGMRASVMLHLPALSATGNMSRLASTVSKLGLTLKSYYTKGATPIADIYQLSNQVTLGISEKSALSNLSAIAMQLVAQERQSRELVIKDDRYIDKIWRSYGILQTAHMINCREFMELVSLVRLGGACGILDVDIQSIDELMIDMQPATINASTGKNLTVNERDILRARMIKAKICK